MTPVSRLALLLGRVLRDVVVMVVQAVVLILTALPFGLRAPLGGVLISLGFVALLALSLTSLSYALALALRSEDTMAPALNISLVPLMLLSGVLLPMALAPKWLDTLSRIIPFRYVVDAMRAAFTGHPADVLPGAAVATVLCVLSVAVGIRTFTRQNR